MVAIILPTADSNSWYGVGDIMALSRDVPRSIAIIASYYCVVIFITRLFDWLKCIVFCLAGSCVLFLCGTGELSLEKNLGDA